MTRHIRGWYALTDCSGSRTEWTAVLPPTWDNLTPDDQAEHLQELALEMLYDVLDCGAEVVDDGAP